jgi:APA family basic amino acid/polyamine antiporter
MPETERAGSAPRVIGAASAFAIVAGSMVGIGIFLSPPIVATHVSSVAMFLALWALGGVISLAGAVACAELGTMMPRAGGDYVFQYEAFGPSVAFASGSVLFAAIFCGSIATLSVGLCTYQLPVLTGLDFSGTALALPFEMTLSWADVTAMAVVLVLTAVNARGTHMSARTQLLLTLAPIVVFSLFAIALLVRPPAHTDVPAPVSVTAYGLAVSYMAIYFAYSGWINIVYVAGEVAEPSRNIPRALIGGTLAVTLLYVLLCAGFASALGMTGLQSAGEAGTATASLLAGNAGKWVITLLIATALTACTNATVLGGARVAYAMARNGALFRTLAALDDERQVPHRALWWQAGLACALILSGRFERLFVMVSLAMVVTGTLTVSSLFVLRKTQPDRTRPYRASGYPWLPGSYVAASLAVIAIMIGQAVSGKPDAWYPLLGPVILVAAYLLHRLWLSRRPAS